MLERIPRGLLVFLVLSLGVGLFFLIQEPHSVCDSQMELFRDMQKGQIYSQKVKNSTRAPLYLRAMQSCRMGNSAGACYELFQIMRKLVRDLNSGGQAECLPKFAEVPEVKRALYESLELLVLVAWGDHPPEPGISSFGWLELPDQALFCDLKSFFIKALGEEAWGQFRKSVYAKFPGEPSQYDNEGKCSNCESKTMAPQLMAEEQIWARSLFALRCDLIR